MTHTQQAIELLSLDDGNLGRCAKCRWLDILIVDGKRFAHDVDYTTTLSGIQPDPWFFVNVARDLKEFDEGSRSFLAAKRFPFPILRRIHEDLVPLGLAPFRQPSSSGSIDDVASNNDAETDGDNEDDLKPMW